MEVSESKSNMLHNFLEYEVHSHLQGILHFKIDNLDQGMKHHGYFLYKNDYKKGDKMWLLKNLGKIIYHWCFWSLYLGGRLILVKCVLESIIVYWISLDKIQKYILEKIRHKNFQSLLSRK